MKQFIFTLIALVIGFLIAGGLVLAAEIGMRYKYDDPVKFGFLFKPDILTHGAMFQRGLYPNKSHPQPRIFCLGGSTTNGCNMPARFSFPQLLQMVLAREGKQGTSYNFGISGVSSVTTNFFIKHILPPYDPACVVIHDGYNDLPIVVKALEDGRYQYILPDYNNPYNPYIKNPVLRYLYSCFKINLRGLRRFTVTTWKKHFAPTGDLFLGFDYMRYPLKEGTEDDIFSENGKRLEIMIRAELDSIDYCLANGIKVIVILEPHIKPFHYAPAYGTGFRDENVGPVLSKCHIIQQQLYLLALAQKYRDDPDVVVLDMREIFKGRYDKLFYDECHLNGEGNMVKAQLIYNALQRLFGL